MTEISRWTWNTKPLRERQALSALSFVPEIHPFQDYFIHLPEML